MDTQSIINVLRQQQTPFSAITSFSKLPGIYAIAFIGNKFPLPGTQVQKNEIVYVGKTESSQEKRDAKTHFTSGKTGSSTVRKSVGAILRNSETLVPIPRNSSDYQNNRNSHYRFDEKSEERITTWMKNNFAIAFYEYTGSKESLDRLETTLIKEIKPILNIDRKNTDNPFAPTIRALRKQCAGTAMISISTKPTIDKSPKPKDVRIDRLSSSRWNGNGKTIYINNITEEDARTYKLRITVDNKSLFPPEKKGIPITHPLKFSIGKDQFVASYTIGSLDGKSRSGILKLGSSVFKKLSIFKGANLKITKVASTYLLERL